MTLERIQKMVHDLVAQGKTPKTFLCTLDDCRAMNLPTWTRQLLGMKMVVAYNIEESKVVEHEYTSTVLKKNQDIIDEIERDAQRQMKIILSK